MRIRMRVNLGHDWPHPWKDHEEHDCDASLGSKLVALNHAVDITPEPVPEPVKPKKTKAQIKAEQEAEFQALLAEEAKAAALVPPVSTKTGV